MDPINISEEFKETIAQFIERSDTNRVDHIISDLVDRGFIDGEFGHLIFKGEEEEYDSDVDLEVLDVVEDEIKKQLLVKYNKQ